VKVFERPLSNPEKDNEMTTCNDFELAVEMRNHGVLPPEDQAPLALHLKECAGCRSFEALASTTEKTMIANAQHQIETADWNALYAATHHVIQRNTRDQMLRGVLALSVATLGLMLMSSRPARVAAIEVFAGGCVFGAIWFVSKKRREALAGIKERGELLFQRRFEIELRLRRMNSALILPVLLPFIYFELQPLLVSTRNWIGFGLLASAILAQTLFTFFVRRPQLQRELRELTPHSNPRE